MAKCGHCKRDMLKADSCVEVSVEIKRGNEVVKRLKPVPYGSESRWPGEEADVRRCHDCNVSKGKLHHPGCDWEECPNCHGQMLMCGGECG